MYNRPRMPKTSIKVNKSYEGVPIERKMERMLNNGAEEADSAPIIYTERQDGIIPDMDIRTDKWEHAVEARDKDTKTELARRSREIGERTYDTMTDDQKKKFHETYPESKIQPPKTEI